MLYSSEIERKIWEIRVQDMQQRTTIITQVAGIRTEPMGLWALPGELLGRLSSRGLAVP